MEPAKIDWKNIDSIFIEDERFEHINAPKWADLLNPDVNVINDEAWFCRPECKHPKTAQDFLNSKHSSSASQSQTPPLRDQNRRDAKLKRRAAQTSNSLAEDSENHNPNLRTAVLQEVKSAKAAIKSSAEKKQQAEDSLRNDDKRVPKSSTLSARNLFVGRDILNHITDFCSELKKLASRVKDREDDEKKEIASENEHGDFLGELDVKENERTPLVEVDKAKLEALENKSAKNRLRFKKRVENAENTPISLNLEKVRGRRDVDLAQTRTNPPTPQCFSASCGALKTTPSKASKPEPAINHKCTLFLKQQRNLEEIVVPIGQPSLPLFFPIVATKLLAN